MAKITTMANMPPIASPKAQPLVVCDEPERTRFLRSKKWTIIDTGVDVKYAKETEQ